LAILSKYNSASLSIQSSNPVQNFAYLAVYVTVYVPVSAEARLAAPAPTAN